MRIVITSDNHYGFSAKNDKKNMEMLEKIAELKPDVFINCGDEGSHAPMCIKQFWEKVRSLHGFLNTECFSTSSNHSKWSSPQETMHVTVQGVMSEVEKIWDEYNVKHPNGKVVQIDKTNIYIGSFDSWYQETNVPTNDWRMTPGLSGVNRLEQWAYLQKKSFDEFTSVTNTFFNIKDLNPKAITILYTHFGFLESEKERGDWKNRSGSTVYFGASTSFEEGLDFVDYLYTGHAHQEYSVLAKNGYTKCASPGGDYEEPKYLVLDL